MQHSFKAVEAPREGNLKNNPWLNVASDSTESCHKERKTKRVRKRWQGGDGWLNGRGRERSKEQQAEILL